MRVEAFLMRCIADGVRNRYDHRTHCLLVEAFVDCRKAVTEHLEKAVIASTEGLFDGSLHMLCCECCKASGAHVTCLTWAPGKCRARGDVPQCGYMDLIVVVCCR